MNPSEVLRIVDAIHRDKQIDKEIVFSGVEAAMMTALKKQHGDEAKIQLQVNRSTGIISGVRDGIPITSDDMEQRGVAQIAKQVMIQKIREAACDAKFVDYQSQIGTLVSGTVVRNDRGTTVVNTGSMEAILPRGEQIPGENFRNNERLQAVIIEVKKTPQQQVRVILSRSRPVFVRRLFEQTVPEIIDGVIEVVEVSRDPGHRTKIAVRSSDQRVDCVGSCVGVRGHRIRAITEELGGERIDIIPWAAEMQVYIPNTLQPAKVEEVILCIMLGRAIVLVNPDQRGLAIGRKGQNVHLTSKLVGWDVEIWTREELEATLERVSENFLDIEGLDEELAGRLVGEGFLSYDDLSIIEPNDLMQMGDITEEEADAIIARAEELAENEDENSTRYEEHVENDEDEAGE